MWSLGAITREALRGPVYLDMRGVKGVEFRERFPGISGFLAEYGLDLARDLVPVRPAAHYLMGGIRTDVAGRTTAAGLVCGGGGGVYRRPWGESAGEQLSFGGGWCSEWRQRPR